MNGNIFSTGELKGIEQALAVRTAKGIVVIAGCSHPGVATTLEAASQFGKPYGIVGGLHGFCDYKILNDLSLIGPCHCTKNKREIRSLFPGESLECGVGLIIEL